MTTRPRKPPRTTIERLAARQAREIRGRLGSELRTARQDAGISLSRLATACGMSKGQLHRIEAGTSQPGWEVLARLCATLGRRVGLTLYPDGGPLVRDHISSAMVEALLRARHERWRPRLEVAVYRPVRGSIDLVLEDGAGVHVVACEVQSDLRRIEQELRWFRAKADALEAAREGVTGRGPTGRVDRLLLLRSTQRTRAIVSQYRDLVEAAYPALARDAYASLVGDAPWPGDAIIWCRYEEGQARLLDRPPRAIRVGR
jgi:transcriptional regulator with XRE-family HTH domain